MTAAATPSVEPLPLTQPRRRAWLRAALSLLIGAAIWLPTLHYFFRPTLADFHQPGAIAPRAQALANRQLHLWEDPAARAAEVAAMRASNAEWDFMGRTFFVLSLCNMAMDQPSQQQRYLAVVDTILDETLRLEREKGMFFFMMDYARAGQFRAQPARSTFLDGEIALMLVARQRVAPDVRYKPLLAERIDHIVDYLSRGPVMCGESYPNECWMFCNTIAAAAVKMSDRLDGRDHSAFLSRWLETVKAKLVDPKSGLLISSFTYDGQPIDGPEGSSIWTIAHFLKIVDPDFAADQYRKARQQLACTTCGFGYAREWPATWTGPMDVDSGPIVPIIGASAGSSGQALLGASSFHDDVFLRELVTTLQFAAFPSEHDGQLRYSASNQVGDAVLLYALVQGRIESENGNGR
jgi:hypothetical protein